MKIVKTTIALTLVSSFCVTPSVFAYGGGLDDEGSKTKEQYVQERLRWAERDPRWNPTREQLETRFDELDVDGDGILTAEEEAAGRGQRGAVVTGGKTKQQFVNERKRWAQRDPRWNPTREQLEEQFDALDVDGDGILSAEEEAAGRGQRGAAVTGGKTKQQFVNERKRWAQRDPRWNPTREQLEEQFDALDVDGDGILTEEEEAAGRRQRTAPAQGQGLTKQQFVNQRMRWAANDPRWNPTSEQLEARFDELDTDGDGILSEEEAAVSRQNRR